VSLYGLENILLYTIRAMGFRYFEAQCLLSYIW